ncbi:hypothetical protein OH76DRAFT_1490120 [Lentinus brumalis]|uniref:Uncharacterized protein n=1 Tax=Lentinus brumalis TaxID=2498619 RepID=A0A371CK12_9APHY|nr:hypothetical protein OH76DRAFT_1490120 [Polyporus brumalis]
MRFLRIVSLNAKNARLTCQKPIKPEMFWRADRGIQHEELGPKDGRVKAWRDHVFEQSPRASVTGSATGNVSHTPSPSFMWHSPPDGWTLDESLWCSCELSEEEEEKRDEERRLKKTQIMMEAPAPGDMGRKERIFIKRPELNDIILSVAQWSMDHHVLTLSLLRRGPVHEWHVEMLNPYYRLMYPMPSPQEGRQELETSSPGVGLICVGVTVRPGDVGYDPRCHPALEALAIFAKEEVLQKSTKDSDRALEIWDDAMSWCIDLLSSAPDSAMALSCLPRSLVRYSRCAEYDAVLRSTEQFVPMPHSGILDLVYDHADLMADEGTALSRKPRGVDIALDEKRPSQDVGNEIGAAWTYAWRMRTDIAYLCVYADDTRSPRAEGWTPEVAALHEVRKLSARLKRYPLSGFIDAALSIVIDALLDGLDLVAAQAFLQGISYFVTPPTEEAVTGTVGDNSRHVLHLPVLLVNHQNHECGLDHSTRNKQRLNCVGAVQFLAALGIKDFPVYGLATSGQYGYVSSTWYSSEDNCIYVADCNTAQHRFDLCEDGMVRFVDFLWGLRQHAEKLKARFDSVREELVERMRTEAGRTTLRWTLRCQLEEPDLWSDTEDGPA